MALFSGNCVGCVHTLNILSLQRETSVQSQSLNINLSRPGLVCSLCYHGSLDRLKDSCGCKQEVDFFNWRHKYISSFCANTVWWLNLSSFFLKEDFCLHWWTTIWSCTHTLCYDVCLCYGAITSPYLITVIPKNNEWSFLINNSVLLLDHVSFCH